jgi:hypothetical protein
MTSDKDCENRLLEPGENAANTLAIEVGRVDDVLATDIPTLAKIDVEGFELGVLDGGATVFASPACRALIVEVSRHHDAVLARIRNFGFTPVDYAPFARTLAPLPGLNPHRGNTIFVRDVAEASARVQSAPRFAVKRTEL